jgi:hypothetical protein
MFKIINKFKQRKFNTPFKNKIKNNIFSHFKYLNFLKNNKIITKFKIYSVYQDLKTFYLIF